MPNEDVLRRRTLAQGAEAGISALEESVKAFRAGLRTDLNEMREDELERSAEFQKLLARLQRLESPPYAIVTFVRFIRT